MIILSILIAAVPSRRSTVLQSLLDELEKQTEDNDLVEILVFYDNKRRTVGEKRNALLSIAKGEYLTFVDDDERVAPN